MRKKWTKKEEETPDLLKFREKRKWQINLRRYVIQQNPAYFYAPYFGLDIKNMRQWFECQFTNDLSWDNFGKKWQFDHVIPVAYFDFSNQEELKLCWNFINIRVGSIQTARTGGNRIDVLASKNYFEELYRNTGYPVCKKLLDKIEKIKTSEIISTKGQKGFINERKEFLEGIENYTELEFEFLNRGKSVEDVRKEIKSLSEIKL